MNEIQNLKHYDLEESRLWLRLIDSQNNVEKELLNEASELMKIFGAIVTKS